MTAIVGHQRVRNGDLCREPRSDPNPAAGEVADHNVLDGQRSAREERDSGYPYTGPFDDQAAQIDGIIGTRIDGDAD
jgi:hypothetical protein